MGTVFARALEWVKFIIDSVYCLTVCACVFNYPDALNTAVEYSRSQPTCNAINCQNVWTTDD